MEAPETKRSKRRPVLAPSERASEILFGLIMVLTFTGSLSAATAGREETRTMLIGALGCNLAWGIVDAVMYLMNTLGERGRDLLILRRVRDAADVGAAHRLIAESLPATVAAVIHPQELEAIRLKWLQLPALPRRPRLEKDDLVGAVAVFLLVFVSIFPVVIPFLLTHNVMLALRLSNAIAIAMLFWVGCSLGRYAGYVPWHVGVSMVTIGLVLVGITILLGG